MSEPRFAALTERLLRAGIAPRHARRAVLELREHHADVVDELRAAGHAAAQIAAQAAERVGPDEAFVREMLARPELRSWAYRRPFVAFTLLPLLAFIGLFVLSIALLMATIEAAQHWRAMLAPASLAGLRWLETACYVLAMWLTPVAAGGMSCLLAARQRIPARWAIGGAILVGLFAALINGRLEVSSPHHGTLSLGVGVGAALLPAIAWRACIIIPAMLLPYLCWLRAIAARSRN